MRSTGKPGISKTGAGKVGLNQRIRSQGIYLLPNLFTTAALFAGFFAVVKAMSGQFEHSAVAIFCAMVLDGMDGRVARMTHTQSEFGAQYDSLADMVSFGVAPALVMYEWALRDLGKYGWMAAFIYCAGAALRLARFNTQVGIADKRFFTGLPSPSAAALVAGLVWLALDNEWTGRPLAWIAFALTLFAGLTMISNVRYWSFKEFNVRRAVPFLVLVPFVLLLVLVAGHPAEMLFALFCLYALSGYLYSGWCLLRKRPPTPGVDA